MSAPKVDNADLFRGLLKRAQIIVHIVASDSEPTKKTIDEAHALAWEIDAALRRKVSK